MMMRAHKNPSGFYCTCLRVVGHSRSTLISMVITYFGAITIFKPRCDYDYPIKNYSSGRYGVYSISSVYIYVIFPSYTIHINSF